MLRDLSIAQARNQLPALVHSVESGPPVRLTRRGKPVAVLLSIREYDRIRPPRPDLWQAIGAFRREADLAALDVDEVFRGVRDGSPGREVDL